MEKKNQMIFKISETYENCMGNLNVLEKHKWKILKDKEGSGNSAFETFEVRKFSI